MAQEVTVKVKVVSLDTRETGVSEVSTEREVQVVTFAQELNEGLSIAHPVELTATITNPAHFGLFVEGQIYTVRFQPLS